MSPRSSHTPASSDDGAALTGATLDIDLGAIQRNWCLFNKTAPNTQMGACVKADAYGLGMAYVAPALAQQGCQHFFVADPQEGVTLRKLLPDVNIYIMDGVFADALDSYTSHRLTPCLKSMTDVDAWCAKALRELPAALHVDTGMHRLGISLNDLKAVKDKLDAADIEPVFLMSHLACADDPAHSQNTAQLAIFQKAQEIFPAMPMSFANSAGVFLGEAYQGDIARPGIGLYGGSPFLKQESPFEAVVSLRGRVLQIQDVPAGDGIGYGASYITPSPSRIAVLGFGYGDGLFRHIGRPNLLPVNNAKNDLLRIGVFFGEMKAPIVGRLSMDQLTVDVSHIPESVALEGAWAEILGKNQTIDDFAKAAGTIGYEVLTSLGYRYHRHYTRSAS